MQTKSNRERVSDFVFDWSAWIALAVAAVVVFTVLFLIPATEADSSPRQSPSPVKAFIDAPDTYPNIIAGCIGRNGWYENQETRTAAAGGELQIIVNDPNCAAGGVLR